MSDCAESAPKFCPSGPCAWPKPLITVSHVFYSTNANILELGERDGKDSVEALPLTSVEVVDDLFTGKPVKELPGCESQYVYSDLRFQSAKEGIMQAARTGWKRTYQCH